MRMVRRAPSQTRTALFRGDVVSKRWRHVKMAYSFSLRSTVYAGDATAVRWTYTFQARSTLPPDEGMGPRWFEIAKLVQEVIEPATMLSLMLCGLGLAFVSEATRWRCPTGVVLLSVEDLNLPLPILSYGEKTTPFLCSQDLWQMCNSCRKLGRLNLLHLQVVEGLCPDRRRKHPSWTRFTAHARI
jgi:hypothetical protein